MRPLLDTKEWGADVSLLFLPAENESQLHTQHTKEIMDEDQNVCV